MSDTPRTDAQKRPHYADHHSHECVTAQFAGELEREVAGLLRDVDSRVLDQQVRLARLQSALREIFEGKGEFDRDRLQHATNTIENMKQLARDALDDSAAPQALATATMDSAVSGDTPRPDGSQRHPRQPAGVAESIGAKKRTGG